MSPAPSAFDPLADQCLNRIADAIDDSRPDLDAELQGGILTVALPDGGQMVINKQAVNQEIWLAAPAVGGHHFRWDGAAWVSTRAGGPPLAALLAETLSIEV